MLAADLAATLETATRLGAHGDLLLRALENRAALAALELEEAGRRLTAAAVVCTLAGVLLLIAGFGVTLLVAAIAWDTPARVPAIAWTCGLELVLALVLGGVAWTRWTNLRLLEHTRDQLTKDAACLREVIRRGN